MYECCCWYLLDIFLLLSWIPFRQKTTVIAFSSPQVTRFDFSSRTQVIAFSAVAMDWHGIDPSHFQRPVVDGLRVAKDETYLHAVVEAWNSEGNRDVSIEGRSIQYRTSEEDDDDSSILHGYIFRRQCRRQNIQDNTTNESKCRLPTILLFHTAAGPHDVFLYYKADMLLQNFNCIVMICDILSDDQGWAWDPDRTRYNQIRQSLLQNNATLMNHRVLAAVENLCQVVPEVDRHQMAAMGWCLGGQPILELANIHRKNPNFSFQALITFHGVMARQTFPDISLSTAKIDVGDTHEKISKVLICNGMDDPFVVPDDLNKAMTYFEANAFHVEIVQLDNAKHGFTNPAQAYNPNPAFGFCKGGSKMAWSKAQELLHTTLFGGRGDWCMESMDEKTT